MQQELSPGQEQQPIDIHAIPNLVRLQASSALMFNKIFLHPFEVKLKHLPSHPQGIPYIQNALNPQSLPQGLLLAHKKEGISFNAYKQRDFTPLSERIQRIGNLKEECLDNMISYLKPIRQGDCPIKLIICICMYSEDKKMLKDTICGVRKNILNLLLHQGMDADSIAVFVIIDGIMSMDPSILTYINQLQQQSLLYLNNYKYLKEKTDIQRQQTQRSQRVYNQSNYVKDNINNFLFTHEEFNEFRQKRLPKVYEEYKEMLEVKKKLEILKKESSYRNVYDQLPSRVQNDFFPTTAKKFCKQNYGISNRQQMKQETLNWLKSNTQDGITVTNDTIAAALNHIQRYMDSRDKLTYVAPFRLLYDEDNLDMPFDNDQPIEEAMNQNYRGFNKLHMNLFICAKYKNSGKLSSHNWFFNGFCKELNPKYTVLMDVGLVPKQLAIVKMITEMEKDETIGGVCGYMCLREEKDTGEQVDDEQLQSFTSYTKCFADIQKTQMLEYHLSHVMDKAFETAFDFIHVLPSAFSGYNMQALKSKGNDRDRLLSEYFKSIQDKIIETKIKPTNLSLIQILLRICIPTLIYNLLFKVEKESEEELLYNQNIFFAEDRILCMEIYKNGFKLAYIPDAISYVDPIKSIHRLMGQRKRWINGSLFAYEKVRKEIYALKGCHLKLRIQVYFYDFSNSLIYFSPSIFFFTINISLLSFNERIIRPFLNLQFGSDNTQKIQTILATIISTFNYIYALILLSMIYYSLNLTALNKYFKISIYFQSAILGTIALIIIIIYLIDTANILVGDGFFFIDSANKDIIPVHRIIVLLIFLSYIVSVLVYSICFCTLRVIGDAIKSTLSFIFYTPTYFIILNFYALCRMDDISWGTKGLDHSDTKQVKLKTKWTLIKLIHVFRYIIWNGAASITLFLMTKQNQPRIYISFMIACCILFIIGTKTIIGSLYIIFYKLKSFCSPICCGQNERERIYVGRQSRIRFINSLLQQKKQQILSRANEFLNHFSRIHNFTQALIELCQPQARQ